MKDELMSPPAHSILKVEGLTVNRGTQVALREVSFELSAGTDTAVVGPNGAGKSTLVQAILGLIPRAAGNIEIFGRPMERLSHLRYYIGYVPQNFVFDRSFPICVEELVGLGWVKRTQAVGAGFPRPDRSSSGRISPPGASELGNTPQSKILNPKFTIQFSKFPWLWQQDTIKSAAIARALQRVNAYHLRERAIGTLSGGQLKRVLLAYCLVMSRQLLILDEAFAGVDVQGAAEFYSLLNELKIEQNWTVLQVSHDLDMVSKQCDRVLCLNQTLVCTGKPEIAFAPQNLLATYGPAFHRYHQPGIKIPG